MVVAQNQPQLLSGFEQRVFELLKLNGDRFVSRSEIEHHLYNDSQGELLPSSNTVQVFILRIRQKGYKITTLRGKGYKLDPYI